MFHRPRNPRRTTVLTAALLAGTMTLTACVGNSVPPPAAGRVTGGPQPGEPATLTVLSQFGDNPALQKVLNRLNDSYRRQNPKVTVKIQYLTLDDLTKSVPTALASGAGPDVIDYDANESSLGALATSKLLMPLDAAAARYGWKGKLTSNITARTTYGGRLYGVGRSSEAVGLFYNADLFRRHGAGEPRDHASFEAAAAKLRSAGVTPITFGNKDLWPSSHLMGAAVHAGVPLATINEIERIGGKGSWTAPAVERAFARARGWVERGWVTPRFNGVGFDDAAKQFFAGKAGMVVEGTGITPDVLENMRGTTVRFVPFPMSDPRIPQQAAGGVGGAWAVSAAAKAPAIAAHWIDFVHFSPEAEREWLQAGVLPTTGYRPGPEVRIPSLVRDNLDVIRTVQAGGGIGAWTGYSSSPLVTEAWNTSAQRFLDGRISAGRFAAELQKALDAARRQARG
ncbi:ABC transporter substrate-binding protein [Actinomadura viridis]|uniref:ABC transporter substrate-binding protein n=1 Tax=Actinomadura viridis TaxID=58110 RepID=UPI0036B4FCF2